MIERQLPADPVKASLFAAVQKELRTQTETGIARGMLQAARRLAGKELSVDKARDEALIVLSIDEIARRGEEARIAGTDYTKKIEPFQPILDAIVSVDNFDDAKGIAELIKNLPLPEEPQAARFLCYGGITIQAKTGTAENIGERSGRERRLVVDFLGQPRLITTGQEEPQRPIPGLNETICHALTALKKPKP